MKKRLVALINLITSFVFLTACGQQEKVRAKIFQRKEVDENRLMIYYQYSVTGKNYVDSATIKNVVIGTDSIDLIIDPANPTKGIPDISN